uniref:AMP deaminase n=1 Tax=Globodera rostochiensis TaxID=31243 RepID=A0A914GU46_GLORO
MSHRFGGHPTAAPPFCVTASVDDETTDPDPLVAEEASAPPPQCPDERKPSLIKFRGEGGTTAAEGEDEPTPEGACHRKSTDSDCIELGPFQSMIGSGSFSGHLISSPYELSQYPIEIQETKSALQRQISNRLAEVNSMSSATLSRQEPQNDRPNSSLDQATSSSSSLSTGHHHQQHNPTGRRWSLQPPPTHQQPPQHQQFRLESIRERKAFETAAAATSGTMSPVPANSPATPTTLNGGTTQPMPMSPIASSPRGEQVHDDIDRVLCSAQHVEMRTFRDAIDVNYQRMGLNGEELSGVPLEDLRTAARSLVEALRLRSEYMERIAGYFPSTTRNFLTGKYPCELPKLRQKNSEAYKLSATMSYNPPEPPLDHWGLDDPLPVFERKFVLRCYDGNETDDRVVEELKHFFITRDKFLKDYTWLNRICNEGPLKTFCYRRLTFLQTHFSLHVLLNDQLENAEQRSVPHRDFYNIRKVDTHIHAASSMNHKHLLRFIKKKMRTDADEVVQEKNGKKVTMSQLFQQMDIRPYDLSVDMLDVHADRHTFHRFDKFNTKYNPLGQNELREIFIKTDNYVNGKYFAQVLKEVLSDLEDNKYQQMEPRLSIYGRAKDEWDKLARWAIGHDVWSPNARWMIQVPRLYDIYHANKILPNFDAFLDNVFTPLFEVTNDPESHPELHRFLLHVSGIDSVDDESKPENVPFTKDSPEPVEYNNDQNPSYAYYLYYMYANLTALNAFRRLRGLNTFALRPHCGEAGAVNHLSVAYLTSESIAHGLLLRKVPVLQYLFYLGQIGIAMSPLSNNHLFLPYQRNPMPEFLMKGLNISLSTDDPLQFHITKEALMEEYSIAHQLWKLSSCDMCELARNSVLQSGFEERVKLHWLGPNYKEEGVLGNDVARTNVPDIRVSFRHESLVNELCNLFKALML